ncbi:MAG TPA: hypothetical protein VMV49_10575 [Candidatus Deferrimicrobium sp.]|nr:hypothetical protein [Candidatus Deferrimicrobium sp.]
MDQPINSKEEKKKVEKATERIEKRLKEEKKSYLKLSIFVVIIVDFLIFTSVLFLTQSPFAIVLVYGFVIITTLIALIPVMIEEYERVGRKPPALARLFNYFLKKVLPIDRTVMRTGPSVLLSYIFLLTIGGFLTIGIYIFADFITQNPNIYDYLISSSDPTQFGFFSFVQNSTANSFIPSILWYLIIFIPVIFCCLFLIASVYYRNTEPSKLLSVVIFSPVMVLLPLILNLSSITSPALVISLIFIGGWIVTLLVWYRFTKRSALMCLSILFAQVLASFMILYGFIFYEVRDTSHYTSNSINISSYYNPLFLLLWFGILVFIPLIIKAFDLFWKGKLRILGVLFSIGAAVIFQFYFFNLFSTSVYDAYLPWGNLDAAEIFVGSGFFFFYIYLILIPLFFIFGYFQIGIARWLYRSFRNFGHKKNHPNAFRILGSLFATLFIVGIVFVYYFFLYSSEDYQNMFAHITSLYNGQIIRYLTLDPAVVPTLISIKSYAELFNVSSLAITVGLFAYSSYRSAYNFALSTDKIEDPDIKRFGVFNFVIFTSPPARKTRVIFGISLIFLFLGVLAIFAFLKIHTVLFKDLIAFNQVPPSLIIFASFDALKLGVSIIGMFVAIVIFFFILSKRRKLHKI